MSSVRAQLAEARIELAACKRLMLAHDVPLPKICERCSKEMPKLLQRRYCLECAHEELPRKVIESVARKAGVRAKTWMMDPLRRKETEELIVRETARCAHQCVQILDLVVLKWKKTNEEEPYSLQNVELVVPHDRRRGERYAHHATTTTIHDGAP